MARYKNKWFPKYGPEYFETEDLGVEYHGYMIYQRPDPDTGIMIFDIVKDGVCVSQMAGINGAYRAIDEMRIDGLLVGNASMM